MKGVAAGLSVALMLSCAQNIADLEVNSEPEGAGIWLDCDSTGRVTNCLFEDVYSGFHHLRVVSAEFEWEDTFTLRRYEAKTVDIEFAEMKFSVRLGGARLGNPVVSDNGTAYVASESLLYAVSPSGSVDWTFRLEGPVSRAPATAIGDDGTIYVLGDSLLFAVSATGTERWRYKLACFLQARGVALGHDGTVYAASDRGLYAVSARGELVWQYGLGYDIGEGCSPPAIGADGTIYLRTDSHLVAFAPAGSIEWTRDIEDSRRCTALAIGVDGTVYASAGGYCHAVSPGGELKWRTGVSNDATGPVGIGGSGTVYFGAGQSFFALNPDGSIRHQYLPDPYGYWTGPAVDRHGTVYFGAYNSLLTVSPNGCQGWRFNPATSGLAGSPTIAGDGSVYFCKNDGYLYVVSGTSGLCDSAWPMYQHDARHTGRAAAK